MLGRSPFVEADVTAVTGAGTNLSVGSCRVTFRQIGPMGGYEVTMWSQDPPAGAGGIASGSAGRLPEAVQ